jgi:hypothetical protein
MTPTGVAAPWLCAGNHNLRPRTRITRASTWINREPVTVRSPYDGTGADAKPCHALAIHIASLRSGFALGDREDVRGLGQPKRIGGAQAHFVSTGTSS